jgi:hypothetical protein
MESETNNVFSSATLTASNVTSSVYAPAEATKSPAQPTGTANTAGSAYDMPSGTGNPVAMPTGTLIPSRETPFADTFFNLLSAVLMLAEFKPNKRLTTFE